MNIGGVEKSFLSLVNALSPNRYEVDLLLLEEKGGFLDFVPEWVNVHILHEYSEIKNLLNQSPLSAIQEYAGKKQWKIWSTLMAAYVKTKITKDWNHYYKTVFKAIPNNIVEYDVAIAFSSIISYVSWYVVHKTTAKKRVSWIHFDISKIGYDEKMLLGLHEQMDSIFAVSQEAKDIFVSHFPNLFPKCEVIHNVVSSDMIHQMATEPTEPLCGERLKIMTLGRLSKEKGQDMIPEIAFRLNKLGIPFTWYLIGDGKLRGEIEDQIQRYGIQDELILLGTKANPYPVLQQADIYVQTSRHEGYCISLAEARALYLPIVTTDFTGAREQLAISGSGTVVECDVESLTGAIADLMEHPEKRLQYVRLLQSCDQDASEIEQFEKFVVS